MTWRLSRKEFDANKGEKNKRALKKLVSKRPPGVLAYDGTEPIGWCAIAPREDYIRLVQHRTLKPVDERFTSKLASRAMVEMGMKKKQRQNKALVDEIAATILLQEWLGRAGQ